MQPFSTLLRSVSATVRFETGRIMRMQRVVVAIIMILFPPTMLLILESGGANPMPELLIAVFSGMICLLSLLLWATSNVYTELEARSWTFVTSRPNGRWAILFGKYFVAFAWSFLIAWIAMTLCMLLPFDNDFQTVRKGIAFNDVNNNGLIDPGEAIQANETIIVKASNGQEVEVTTDKDGAWSLGSRFAIWRMFTTLLFLASMSYSAIFSLMGVIIQRRAMMFGVGYFIAVEMILWFVPALLGKIAMSHHMVAITIQDLGNIFPLDGNDAANQVIENYNFMSPWIHYLAIFVMTAFCLSAAAMIVRFREYLTLEDSQF